VLTATKVKNLLDDLAEDEAWVLAQMAKRAVHGIALRPAG
jgi:hypothetical protein